MARIYTNLLTNNQFSNILPSQLWSMLMYNSNPDTTLNTLMQEEQATTG
jgi:hypothetical protein